METVAGRGGNVGERLVRGNGRYAVGRNGYTEDDDESSDSAASSEFSTTQAGSVSSALPRSRLRMSEGYASSAPSLANVESNAQKVCFNNLTVFCNFEMLGYMVVIGCA